MNSHSSRTALEQAEDVVPEAWNGSLAAAFSTCFPTFGNSEEPLEEEVLEEVFWFLVGFLARRPGKNICHPSWRLLKDSAKMFGKAKFATHNHIEHALQEAWREQDFNTIINAAFLHQPVPLESGISSDDSSQIAYSGLTEEDHIVALKRAWETPYAGSYHKELYCMIEKMKVASKGLSIASVIQSSGTGKSRMANELASLLVTIPFNLRTDEDSTVLAYPPPDQTACDFFLAENARDQVVRIRYHAFFMALFRRVSEFFKQQGAKFSENGEEVAKTWNLYLQENRGILYKEVCADADKYAKEKTSPLAMFRDCVAEIETLFKTIPAYSSAVRLLVYFDGAHELAERKTKDSRKSLYSILLSVLCDYEGFPLFFLFLSTEPRVSRPVPPPTMTNSARSIASKSQQAPIIETPFDCAEGLCVEPGKHMREEFADITLMAKFGRPLYWSLLKQGVNGTELINMIRGKLIASSDIEQSFVRANGEIILGLLAVVDVRLCIQYEPYLERNVTQSLVANHMRVMYAMPSHRQYFHSGYSSEPILAEAAAQQMNYWQSTSTGNPMFHCIAEEMKSGLLDWDQRGEIVARMLLTMAYDRAVKKAHLKFWFLFSSGCPLVEFIKQLVPSNVAQQILQAPPSCASGGAFQNVFERSWVRWTHFVKAGDNHVFHRDALFAAFARGMAFICQDNQAYVDLLIPVLLDGGSVVGPENMSAIFVQVKRRERPIVSIDVDKHPLINFFKDDDRACDHPYITLVMDLGLQDLPEQLIDPKVNSRSLLVTRPPRPSAHPKYFIHLVGCTHKTYSVIRKDEEVQYKQLLHLSQLLHDHSREETIPSVLSLKPLFLSGDNSYGWVKSDTLGRKYTLPAQRCMVRVDEDEDMVDEDMKAPLDQDKDMEDHGRDGKEALSDQDDDEYDDESM